MPTRYVTPVLAEERAKAKQPTAVSYTDDVLPILAQHCFRCHGPDAESRRAGLRLDQRASAVGEADSGYRAIVPRHVQDSELWNRVSSHDDGVRMPPVDAGQRLSAEQQTILKRWIESGANYQQHWAFVAAQHHPLPDVGTLRNQQSCEPPESICNPIDVWIAQRLVDAGLRFQPAADPPTLVRRVTLDLTGLPPTPSDVSAYLADSRPGAYERLVDRLLASPAFGERWARSWLDLARYADSAGYAQDPPREIWRYRDWLIDALNQSLPYDQFTIEQLAGDLLDNPTNEQLLATAFHRNTMTNSEGGTDDEEFRNAAVVDRVNTTMQVWMGITFGCAQCHDHKYDPISQKEYYRFFAVFNNTADADRGDERPLLTEWTPQQQARRQELTAQITRLEKQLSSKSSNEQANHARGQTETPGGEKSVSQRLTTLKKRLAEMDGVTTPIMRELPDDQRRATHIQLRGNFLNRGQQVEPGVPELFPPLESNTIDRLSVAKWLVDPNNPLTARVAVNRVWEQLFGAGIVETTEDFGTQGERPTHPELLDYLARELIRADWDLKQLIKKIVCSHTYRQSSVVTRRSQQIDPRNRLLSHAPSYRLPAEMIRDQALAISGLLSRKMFGPSVRPPRPKLGLRAAFGASTDWETSPGEDRYRRGLYTRWRRTTPYPSMTTFDAPSREVCTIRRIRTNTPLQALVTLNDPAFFQAAQALAGRMMAETTGGIRPQIRYGLRLCVAREPRDREIDRLEDLFHATHQTYRDQPKAAERLVGQSTRSLGDDPTAHRAALTVVANVLLNLDEVLTKK